MSERPIEEEENGLPTEAEVKSANDKCEQRMESLAYYYDDLCASLDELTRLRNKADNAKANLETAEADQAKCDEKFWEDYEAGKEYDPSYEPRCTPHIDSKLDMLVKRKDLERRRIYCERVSDAFTNLSTRVAANKMLIRECKKVNTDGT
jgi:hypothetical protein